MLVAALRLIDGQGVDALSMRRLGRALECDPMRLYRFAASKDELLDGIVELVLSELQVPTDPPAHTWPDVLRAVAHTYRDLALRHPHVVPLLVTRPLSTPLGLRPLGTLRPLEALLELLIRAGFDARGALHAYRLYMGFLQGHVLTELQERVQNADETDALLRLGLYRLPAREFPRLRSLPPRSPPTTARASSTRVSTSSSMGSDASSTTPPAPDHSYRGYSASVTCSPHAVSGRSSPGASVIDRWVM